MRKYIAILLAFLFSFSIFVSCKKATTQAATPPPAAEMPQHYDSFRPSYHTINVSLST